MPDTPVGTQLREPEDASGRAAVATLIVVAFVSLFLVPFVRPRGLVLIALGALLVFAYRRRHILRARLGWHKPSLQVSSTAYSLGSYPTVVYRRRPRRVTDIADCQVQARLVCRERATYELGDETKTDERDVYVATTLVSGHGTADGLSAEIELDISARQGAPSFKLPSNEVMWLVEISSVGTGLPQDSHEFAIEVAAVLDPAMRVRVQDT